MTEPVSPAEKVTSHAKDLAQDASDALKSEANAQAAEAKSAAVQGVEQVADAADAASQSFDPGTMQRQALSQIAEGIEGVAAQLRDTDLQVASRKVSDFARENPLIFVGGAALVGFALTRFLSARSPQAARYEEEDVWTRFPHGQDPHRAGQRVAVMEDLNENANV